MAECGEPYAIATCQEPNDIQPGGFSNPTDSAARLGGASELKNERTFMTFRRVYTVPPQQV